MQPAHTARAPLLQPLPDNHMRPARVAQLMAVINWKCMEWQFSVRVALAARDASTHLTEWDETMAVETRGGAEVYMETLCDVLGLGCQWADFSRRTCV